MSFSPNSLCISGFNNRLDPPLLLIQDKDLDCNFLQQASYTFLVAMIYSSFNLSIGTLFNSRAELPKFSTAKIITHIGLQSAIPATSIKLNRKYTVYSFSFPVRVHHQAISLLNSFNNSAFMVHVVFRFVTHFYAATHQSHFPDRLRQPGVFPVSQRVRYHFPCTVHQ
nr:MAG TPA: hypothetical protein [Caudoviricetes sp.]